MQHTETLTLTTDDGDLDIEVSFFIRDDEIILTSVTYEGEELVPTSAQDGWILEQLYDTFFEYQSDELATIADLRNDERRDNA